MTEQEERPLVTFALFAYNQECFIREAIEGALAQTYSPLQVILSDDCSSDRTFEIMQAMVSDYAGPHEVLLNRNERNLGIGGHVNRVMDLARGDFIVVAAGDDISFPERTSALVDRWLFSDKKISSVYSNTIMIDAKGNDLGVRDFKLNYTPESRFSYIKYMIENLCIGVIGCSHAWDKKSYELFGGMLEDTVYEDRVIPFRAVLAGEILHVADPLVKYRVHPESITMFNTDLINEKMINKFVCGQKYKLNALKNYKKDLLIFKEHNGFEKTRNLGDTETKYFLSLIDKMINECLCYIGAVEAKKTSKLSFILKAVSLNISIKFVLKVVLFSVAPNYWCALYRYKITRTLKLK